MLVTSHEYEEDKKLFFRKHKNNFECETQGSSAEYYRKTYTFKDGAVWYEVMTKEEVEDTVEIYKCNVKVKADMFKTEYWNTDDAASKIFYEPWDHNQ